MRYGRKEKPRKKTSQDFSWFVGNCFNKMKWNEMNWSKFLDFSSVCCDEIFWKWIWMAIQIPLCICIIQICLADFNEINSILFNIFRIDLWFFFFEQAQLFEVKHFFLLNFMRIEHELLNQAIHKIKKEAAEK